MFPNATLNSRFSYYSSIFCVLFGWSGAHVMAVEADVSAPSIDYAAEVVPILVAKCLACHDQKTQEGNYSISDSNALFRAGDSGAAPVVAFDLSSELLHRITTEDETLRMPADADPLPVGEIEKIKIWIARGANVNVPSKQPLAEVAARVASPIKPPEHYPFPIPVHAVRLLPGGTQMITSGYGELLVWNLQDATLITRLALRGTRVSDIDVSTDGQLMVVSSGTPGSFGTVQAFHWDGMQWQARYNVFQTDIPLDVAISPDSQFTLIGQSSGSIQKIANNDGTSVLLLESHAAAITSVAWSADNTKFYSASRDRSAKSYAATDGQVLASYVDHERVVGGVVPSPQGAFTLDETGRLRNWNENINPRSLATFGDLPARVSKVLLRDDKLFVLEPTAVRVLQAYSEKVEDGKDDKGETKFKTAHRFKALVRLDSPVQENLLSLDVQAENGRVLIVAGSHTGKVIIWSTMDPQHEPVVKLLKP